MNRKSIGILALVIALFIALFSSAMFSDSSDPFITRRNCSITWGGDCDSDTINDTFDTCNGTQSMSGIPHVKEVYINASSVLFGNSINVTCRFEENGNVSRNYEYAWYWNETDWLMIANWSNSAFNLTINRSVVLKPNSTEGTHIVRCIYSYFDDVTSECANISNGVYDNDDVNFTVTYHLTYDFWNLTNYTNGSEIASGQNYTINDSINVSAHWNKSVSLAQIEHNGTGTWRNYTICTYPNCTGNWTNYTLNLSNSLEFNNTVIAIRSIYANDTFSATNNTSTILYFYLSVGNAPNVTNFWFNYSGIATNVTNEYTNLTIYANVSDDVGLSAVIANVTYPSNASVNATMVGDTSPGWHTWNYTFNSTLQLNQTGNYTVRIVARDIGGQEKASGVDYPVENMTFYVNNTYKLLNLSTNHSTYNRGENITIQVWDVNDFPVYNLNWTITLVKDGLSPSVNNYNNTNYTYQIANDDPEGSYDLLVVVSKNNNSGANLWSFNASKNLTLTISTSQALSPGNLVVFSANLYNARGELYNSTINANISCVSGWDVLNFSSGQASYSCTIPSAYSTSFTVYANASDQYNNTGENTTTFTTTSAPPSSPSGGGGGGSPKIEIKNCTDGTPYGQCNASKRPIYCSAGKLLENCSICGCMPEYSCQTNGSCKITALENFSFTTDVESIEIIRGEDGKAIASLSNTGNTLLSLLTETESDCCNVTMESSIGLNKSEDRDISLLIHVPLFVNPGEYILKIKIGKELFKKEKTIKVLVEETPYYDSIKKIKTALSELENEVTEYKKSGVDVTSLRQMIQESKTLIQSIDNQISADDLSLFKDSVLKLEKNVNSATSYVLVLRTQKVLLDNKFLIIVIIAMIIITVYFVPEVLIPLQKVENEIKKLKNDEKVLVNSRVETEKQYFMRKIDENTFSKIMITKQDNILKLRSTTHEKEFERMKILSRAHPKEMAKWFGRSIKDLPKNMKNLFVRAYVKIKPSIKFSKK